jgi:hypothetical protein
MVIVDLVIDVIIIIIFHYQHLEDGRHPMNNKKNHQEELLIIHIDIDLIKKRILFVFD